MGLLDAFEDPGVQLGLGLLAAGGPSAVPMSPGQRIAGAFQQFRQQRAEEEQRKMMQAYREAQIAQMKEAVEQKALARQMLQGRQEILARGAMPISGGQAASIGGGPTNAAAQLVGQRPGYSQEDIARYLAFGGDIKDLQGVVESRDWGRPKVARTIETTDANGKPITVQVDEFGKPVGEGFQQWKAPVQVNRGDRTDFVDPVSLAQRGSFGINMSPSERASNAVAWANHNLSRERLNFDKQDGKAPSGYRWNASGQLEAIPGGPADESKKPMTDAQGKANLFGTRAAQANSVLDGLALGGVTRPGNINSAASAVPFIGNQLSNLTNWTQSSDQQMVGQAQRDFINAILRRESGAVISDEEFRNAERQYFPQAGDSPDTIALKKRNRETAVSGILSEVPESKRSPMKPFSRIVKLDDGSSVAARLDMNDGNYYVIRNGKKYRVEE